MFFSLINLFQIRKGPRVCVHVFICSVLLSGCGSHVPVKGEFRILQMRRVQGPGKGGTGSLANLSAHRKDFKSAI